VLRLLRLRGANDRIVTRVTTLDDAVTRATELAESGDVVLLSPGGTSYDAYQDFAERGEHFRRLVAEL
jgi:UDP-N-acetylmuramoylalanine--D-glutamate ligase